MTKLLLLQLSDELHGIVLSTVHKSKGLEADRVFIARPDKMPLPTKKAWQHAQEMNQVIEEVDEHLDKIRKTIKRFKEEDPSDFQEILSLEIGIKNEIKKLNRSIEVMKEIRVLVTICEYREKEIR